MKAMLLRVGIDKGTDGALSPIFEDGSFEFIPISLGKTSEDKRVRTYKNTIGRTGKPLSYYLPRAIENRLIHDDPEFETFTYGDDTSKRNYVLKLIPDDLLVFYAGLAPFKNNHCKSGLYIVGYFTIEQIIDFNELRPDETEHYNRLCARNAHIVENSTRNLVVAKGVKNRSRLLDCAILISQVRSDRAGRPNLAVSDEMQSLLGISGSIQRSIPPRFIVSGEYLTNLRNLIGL
jgi:hypothetical protein